MTTQQTHLTDVVIQDAAWRARVAAHNHLDAALLAWRRHLWPDARTDPISRENSLRRMRRELAVQALWSLPPRPMYGGICGA